MVSLPKTASLDHALWLHRPFRADDWVLHAQGKSEALGSRGYLRGLDGKLVASMAQKAWCASRGQGDSVPAPRNGRLHVTTETLQGFQLDQMEVRVVEYEAIVQHRDDDGFA